MAKDIGSLRTKLSFEKTGDSNITDLNRDLRGLRSELTVFKSSGREFRTSLSGMKTESDILTRRLDAQKEKVSELARRYEESKRVNGENADKTKELAAQYNYAQAEMQKTEQQLARLNDMIRTQESAWTKLGDKMIGIGDGLQRFGRATTDFGKAYSLRVTAPILAAGTAALKVGMDFEEGMSKVQAVSGASGEELESLKDMAKDLGATTKFSATEASEGLYYMGLAGWKTQEMLDGLPGVLDLAAASGEDLGRTSDIVTDGLSAFGMKAKDSARFADVLAAASSNANTDVSGLGAAFQYVAPVAGALGFTIEDTAKAIGLMANSGIKGQKAGTALRTMMTNLAKPTKEMKTQMDKLGISLTDSEGNMKSFDAIMGDLRKGFKNLTEEQQASAAATIFGKESMSGALAIINASEEEYKKLSKSINESEGAASKMASIMQDNAKGAMTEFKSALEGAGIAISEHLIPAVTDIIRKGTDLVRKFGELDSEQQKQILKWAGIVAAVGPAAIVLGKVATVTGTVISAGGKLAKMIGASNGVGLLGALSRLGPLAVGGIAVAGLVGISAAIYNLVKDKNKLNEVSTEAAEKMWAEASGLEKLVDEYEKLQDKSKLTTDQFARLVDIQAELNRTGDPQKIEKLKDEYNKLAKESGLSADEVDRLVKMNNDIVEQSPAVEQSISNQGNAIVDNTDAVREYISALREMSLNEFSIEREAALENEQKLLKENKDITEQIAHWDREINILSQAQNMTQEQIAGRLSEIDQLLRSGKGTDSERLALAEEQEVLRRLEKESAKEILDNLRKQKEELLAKKDLNDEELKKIDELNKRYADLLLEEININNEKGDGIEKLDEQIAKLVDQKKKLEANTSEAEKQNDSYKESISKLDEQIGKHESVKKKLNDELGLQSEKTKKEEYMNALIQEETNHLNNASRATSNQGKAQDNTNKKIKDGVGFAAGLHRELIKDATKNVKVTDGGTLGPFETRLRRTVTKTVNIRAGRAIGSIGIGSLIAGYAKGTPPSGHPGGAFVAGEEGWELGRLGNKWEMLNFGMYDRPKGYEVFTHNESKRILSALNNMPGYATGARPPREADNVVRQMNTGNSETVGLLERIARAVESGQSIVINGKEIANVVNEENAINSQVSMF